MCSTSSRGSTIRVSSLPFRSSPFSLVAPSSLSLSMGLLLHVDVLFEFRVDGGGERSNRDKLSSWGWYIFCKCSFFTKINKWVTRRRGTNNMSLFNFFYCVLPPWRVLHKFEFYSVSFLPPLNGIILYGISILRNNNIRAIHDSLWWMDGWMTRLGGYL